MLCPRWLRLVVFSGAVPSEVSFFLQDRRVSSALAVMAQTMTLALLLYLMAGRWGVGEKEAVGGDMARPSPSMIGNKLPNKERR